MPPSPRLNCLVGVIPTSRDVGYKYTVRSAAVLVANGDALIKPRVNEREFV